MKTPVFIETLLVTVTMLETQSNLELINNSRKLKEDFSATTPTSLFYINGTRVTWMIILNTLQHAISYPTLKTSKGHILA